MIINKASANANRWTFRIKPIKRLVDKYVEDGKGWVDPFAGMFSPAEFTNDLNENMKTMYHMDSLEFCNMLNGNKYEGVIFDPPYSFRQIKDCYTEFGLKLTQLDTSNNFYNRVMNAICDKIKPGGYAISCGWNSNGFGKRRGFYQIEILLVAHGSHANDTIVTVEKKIYDEN